MNDELRSNYSKLFYEYEVSQYFKEILNENINVHLARLNKLKKRNKITEQKAKLNQLIHSLKHYNNKMLELDNDINDVSRLIALNKKDLINEEQAINKRIYETDSDLYQAIKPLSEEIFDNLQEIHNINEALKLCDLIRYKHKHQYELCDVYGIHNEIFIKTAITYSSDYLFKELSGFIDLINKRYTYRRSNYALITERISINTISYIIDKLYTYLQFLETEIIELRKTRINVMKRYGY